MNVRDLDTLRPTPLQSEIERRRASSAPLRPIPDPNRLGRRVMAGIVAFVVFGLAVAVGTGLLTHRSSPQPAGDPWEAYRSGWSELPAPPQWRDGESVVWTGHELLYWGGVPRDEEHAAPLADGFSFDPVDGIWSTMPGAPQPSAYGSAVWTGTEALFFSFAPTEVSVQAFDPTKQSWRSLPNGPPIPSDASWAWTGSELTFVGGGRLGEPSNTQGWALNPSTGSWRELPDAPVPMNLSDAAWTGTHVVVVGSARTQQNQSTTSTALAQEYDPVADSWQQLAPPPVSGQTSAVAWVGGRLIAWELYTADAAEYLPREGRWRSFEMGGLDGSECYASGVTVGTVLFTWNCGAPAAWFAETSAWSSLELPIEPAAPGYGYGFGDGWAAGSAVVVEQIETVKSQGEPLLGSSNAPIHLWAWVPPPVAPDASWEPTTLDAEQMVDSFIGDLFFFDQTAAYTTGMATKDVIDRSRSASGGLVPVGRHGWRTGAAREIAVGVFKVPVHVLDGDKQVIGTDIFTVGPGTASDGRVGRLIITDVQPA